ncbi:PepSY-associated TM helix domain-containing protein [Aureliella helgolandensis]|uniref:PepSY-associated TM helix n=1 Tax=Aureliella helgolandensis TaxID=2527968 RepID=A0A518G556_9BACT|nr:PepSY-associated TM helix domain-containing protein [Aureliella helgolandensis]QDV23723.1 hypothetical protein Q31a_20280 [Aureliella helgolandensis]
MNTEQTGTLTNGSRKPPHKRKRGWYAQSAVAFRWLHIYLSMLSFAALMFFAFTGLTLNHPTWFGAGEQTTRDATGELPLNLLNPTVDKLEIAEQLRSQHQLRGRVAEFEVDAYECMLVFKGPGYAADAFVTRESGQYTLSVTSTGMMAIMNDLHKGRDSGVAWSIVIDVSAIFMILVSLSGFGLLFFIKKRRAMGFLVAFLGTILLIAAWLAWVP